MQRLSRFDKQLRMTTLKLSRHDKKINFGDSKNMLFYSFIAKVSILIEEEQCTRNDLLVWPRLN